MGPCLFFLLISSKEIYHFFILYDQQGHGVMKTYCNPDNLMQLVDPEFPNLMLRTPCVMEENPIIAFVNLIETCRQFVHENAIKLWMFMHVFLETAKGGSGPPFVDFKFHLTGPLSINSWIIQCHEF